MSFGKALDRQGNLPGALEYHRRALQQFEQLLHGDASNPRVRSGYGVVQRLIGAVLTRQGRTDLAIVAFENSLATAEKLAADEPTNQAWLRELTFSHTHLAAARAQAGELRLALEHQRKGLALTEQMAAQDATNASSQSDLADRLWQLGELLVRDAEPEPALAAFERARTINDALVAQAPADPAWAERARKLRKTVATCCNRREGR
jgi:tetratricopeptide (TPR) repeat protein